MASSHQTVRFVFPWSPEKVGHSHGDARCPLGGALLNLVMDIFWPPWLSMLSCYPLPPPRTLSAGFTLSWPVQLPTQ
jgi:hypothetical protein